MSRFFVGDIKEDEGLLDNQKDNDEEISEERETQDDSADFEEEEISEEEYQKLYKQLDDAFNAEPLQKIAKDHGVEWEGNRKENVIEAIILEDKVEDILSEEDE